MYNTNAPKMGTQDWQVILRLARAAQKYDCARAKDVAASYFAEQEQLGCVDARRSELTFDALTL